jgi:DNA-directed RNA polymerase specialized sigma24 family protein
MEHGDCIKETKRILGQYNKMKVAVQNLAEEIEARTAALQGESVAIARYGDEPMGGTSELTATEAAAEKRMKTTADIAVMEQRKQDMERTLRAVDRALACLSADDERLVRGRYIDGYAWQQAGHDVGYTEKWAKERGRKALRDMAMMLFGTCEKPLQTRLIF